MERVISQKLFHVFMYFKSSWANNKTSRWIFPCFNLPIWLESGYKYFILCIVNLFHFVRYTIEPSCISITALAPCRSTFQSPARRDETRYTMKKEQYAIQYLPVQYRYGRIAPRQRHDTYNMQNGIYTLIADKIPHWKFKCNFLISTHPIAPTTITSTLMDSMLL